MRPYVVAAVLASMMTIFVFVLVKRPRTSHVAPAPTAVASTSASSGGDAGAKGDAAGDATGDTVKIEKTLRVATLGFDIAAPAIVENDGVSPGGKCAFAKDEIEVHLSPTDQAPRIEAMLARGGDDPEGADVAVLPLAAFASSHERLRALDPRVFLVVGWSRGREAISVSKDGALATFTNAQNLSPQDEAKVVSSPTNENANMLALLVLDLAGVPSAKTKLVASGKEDRGLLLTAIDRGTAGAPTKFLITSADTRLLPIVAIAPRGVIERRGNALRALSKGWFEGLDRVKKDAPGAARVVSATKGSPEAIALLERLGQIEPVTLRDDAQLLGLSGRGAITIARLFARVFQIDRAMGVLTAPPPEEMPLDTSIVAALVRADASLAAEAPNATTAQEPALTPAPKATLLFVRRVTEGTGSKLDTDALALDAAFLTAAFDRATVRLSMKGGLKAAKPIVLDARERFAASPTRLVIGDANLGNASALLEVWLGP